MAIPDDLQRAYGCAERLRQLIAEIWGVAEPGLLSVLGVRGESVAALPEALRKAREAIEPVLGEIRAVTKGQVIACGNRTAPTGHDLLLRLGGFTEEVIRMALWARDRPTSELVAEALGHTRAAAAEGRPLTILPADVKHVEQGIREFVGRVDWAGFDRLRSQLQREADDAAAARGPSGASKSEGGARKRSTERGEAQLKISAGLTEHHKYADESCLCTDPIGVKELARRCGVSSGSVSKFFKKEFGSHANYRAACCDARLVGALKILNCDLRPTVLFQVLPEERRGDDD